MTVLSAMCALSLYVGRVGLLAFTKALLFQRSACSRGYATWYSTWVLDVVVACLFISVFCALAFLAVRGLRFV